MNIVIPAGGTIPDDYARRIGSPYRALAPIGPDKTPVLQRVVNAFRDSGTADRIIVVADPIVQKRITGVDIWLADTGNGAGNICHGLEALEQREQTTLVCTSDLPLLQPADIHEFLARTREDIDISLGIVTRDSYEQAFPGSPMSAFVNFCDYSPVTLSGLFRARPSIVLRNRSLLENAFSGRKNQWKMVCLLGPRLLCSFALRRFRLRSVQARAERLLHCCSAVVKDCPPALAFDIDTADDYSYANTRIY